jgi:hypothetical protein
MWHEDLIGIKGDATGLDGLPLEYCLLWVARWSHMYVQQLHLCPVDACICVQLTVVLITSPWSASTLHRGREHHCYGSQPKSAMRLSLC